METQWIVRNGLIGAVLMSLLWLIMRKKQVPKLNWAAFYASLWVFCTLPLVNWLCVKLGLWYFTDSPKTMPLYIPYDLLFVWIVIWGVVPSYIFKGKKIALAAIVLLWVDLLYMPALASFGILSLNGNWALGELLLIGLVYIPAHLWVRLSLAQTYTLVRSCFQLICVFLLYSIGLPMATGLYFPIQPNFGAWFAPYVLQIAFILVLPALVAVMDLSEKGKGTPFPYDPTHRLVRGGVYAYIRNPIQWSLTALFIPLAVLYGTPVLLVGIIISVAYTIGVSNPQEFTAMEARFGESWTTYKASVPAWGFLWRPNFISKGTIYLKKGCTECSEVRAWLENQRPVHLDFRHAEDYQGNQLLQVTYIDDVGNKFTSVTAIAHALGHINLAWASLGWLMRLPGICHMLQLMVDAMGLKDEPEVCDTPIL